MAQASDQRRALLWLVSAFGAVAVARYEAHAHQNPAPDVPRTEQHAPPLPEAEALRDGRPLAINRAGAEELSLLPGVGPSLARRLVEARTQGGPFRKPADLRRVKGVGERTVQKLSPFLSFDSE